MNLAKRTAKGVSIVLVGQVIRAVLQLATMSVLARQLLPGDFGTVSMVLSIVGIAAVIGDFGLSMASVQAGSIPDEKKNTIFFLNLLIGTGLAILIIIFSVMIADFYHKPELAKVAKILAVVFVLNGASAQFRAEHMKAMHFGWLSLVDLVGQVCGSLAAFFVASEGGGYWAMVAYQIGIASGTLLCLIFRSDWRPRASISFQGLGPLLQFSGGTLGVQLVNYISSNADSVIIGRFIGSIGLGFYDRAFQIFRIPLMQIALPLSRVLFPVLSRVADSGDFERHLKRSQLLMMGLMGSAYAISFACAPSIVRLLLGDDWTLSISVLSVLSVGGIFQSATYPYFWAFMARAETGVQFRLSLAGRSLMVAFMALGVHWGIFGVALGCASGFVVNLIVLTWWGMPKLGVQRKVLFSNLLFGLPVLLASSVTGRFVSHLIRSDVLSMMAAALTVVTCAALAGLLSRDVSEDVRVCARAIRSPTKGLEYG